MPENREQHGFMANLQDDLSQIELEGKRRIRSQKRLAVEKRSEILAAEQEKISRTIRALYDAVYHYPDKATPEILMDFVRDNRGGKFSPQVTEKFSTVLDRYKEKRTAVQKFIRDTRDGNLMFEKCFGVKPKGKIEVIPGPMTICFRCFDDEDYMAATVHSENDPEQKSQVFEKFKRSSGVAFSAVKDSSLPQASIIAERVGTNFEDRPLYRKREVQLRGQEKNTWQRFNYPTSKESNLIYFKIPVIGEVEAHLRRDTKGEIEAVWLMENADGTTLATFDPFEKTERFKIAVPTKKYGGEEWVELEFADDSFAIFDHTKTGSGFETVEYMGTERVIKDKEASKQIRIHEEQHQFNKLFEPADKDFFSLPYSEFKRLSIYAKNHPEENSASLVAKKFAQIYRQAYIDPRARDEIIAYTREGFSPGRISNILCRDPLYDFKQQTPLLTNGKKTTWENYIKFHVTYLTKAILEKGQATFTIGPNIHVVEFDQLRPWTVQDQETAQTETVKTLTEDYERKLKRWTSLIKNMRDAGYETKDIVPFLNMLPINKWHSAIRRLLKSKSLRPIDFAQNTRSQTA